MHYVIWFQRTLFVLSNLERAFSQWSAQSREPRLTGAPCVRLRPASSKDFSTKPQMSLSSFGNFSASGAVTLRAPDCSSALGLYVPSVCLFFFTTQNSQTRKAETKTSTPRVTVGATMAAMLGPCKQKNSQRCLMTTIQMLFTFHDSVFFFYLP